MENKTSYNKILAYLAGGMCFLYLLIIKVYLGGILDYFYSGNIPQKVVNYLTIYYFMLVGGFFTAIVFLLKRKRWSLWLLQMLCAVVFITTIKQLVMVSYSSIVGIGLIILFGLAYLTIGYCAKKSVKMEFGAKIRERKKKFFLVKWGIGFLIVIVVGIFGYVSFYYYVVYPQRRAIKAYNWSESDMKKLANYEILNYSIKLPAGLIAETSEDRTYLAEDNVTLTSEDGAIRVILNVDPFNPMYSVFGYKNSYEMTRRTNRLSRMALKFLDEDITMDEVKVNKDLDGFFASFKTDRHKVAHTYYLYLKRDRNVDGQIMIADTNGFFTERQWEGLINGIKLK